ncbi:uncharacterized protein C8Q71DRAFT_882561 [Rhodofomes roseus]|uniref:DUF6534 domain-containing protein n=1 Tax=Rhodofomes roseus TaxID=34475 RepID=A0ABQ8K3C7_9APHY|nr:uncharacterized protein C8Q71DRAFT_882561 [Rhodofomes roseus]KAH9831149.1 hypothetical protein C8Q71DRAFT_882561 [Rhodofomes roseus]
MTEPKLELDGSLGCIFFVGLFSLMLYGCTCGQVLYYITHYGFTDHRYITIIVILIWILDTGKTIVDMICGWEFLVWTHGDAFALLARLPGILPGEFVLSCSTIFIIQCCYLHTIWRFLKESQHHRHWVLFMLPPLLLTVVSLIAGLVGAMQIRMADGMDMALSKAKATGSIRPGCSAIVDIYITVWLCYHLHDARTGHKRSDTIVTKLISYAITRGFCTSVAQVLAFALFLVDSRNDTLYSMIFYIPASTLYVNSLLAMWNARKHITQIGTPTIPSTWGGADISLEDRSMRSSSLETPTRRERFASRPSTLAGSSFMEDFDR